MIPGGGTHTGTPPTASVSDWNALKVISAKWSIRIPVICSTVATAQVGPPRFIARSNIDAVDAGTVWVGSSLPSHCGRGTTRSRGIETTVAHLRSALMCTSIAVSEMSVPSLLESPRWLPCWPSRVCEPSIRMFSGTLPHLSAREAAGRSVSESSDSVFTWPNRCSYA